MDAHKYIALGHKSRVGKDTVADYICMKGTWHCVRLARPLYVITAQIQAELGMPIRKDPMLLQAIGSLLRATYGKKIFCRVAEALIRDIRAAHPDDGIIVTDMRFRNEMKMLRRLGFTTVKVVRDFRPIDRDPQHESEVDLDGAEFDIVLYNNGTIHDLHNEINATIVLPADPIKHITRGVYNHKWIRAPVELMCTAYCHIRRFWYICNPLTRILQSATSQYALLGAVALISVSMMWMNMGQSYAE